MARTSRAKNGDPEVGAEERGDAAKALSAIGIEVYDQNGAYQDFSVTLDQLSAKWDQLTDSQREKKRPKSYRYGRFLFASYIGNNIVILGEPYYPAGVHRTI